MAHHAGFDELMIVNPGARPRNEVFIGDDGRTYRLETDGRHARLGLIQGCGCGCGCCDPQPRSECRRIGELYLGDDGALYTVR